MKWMVKAAVQAGLGLLPAKVADPIYHRIQQQKREIPTDIDAQRSFINEVACLYDSVRGKTLDGQRIVELGSGWFPILPLLLTRQFGAKTVQTFDINHHYSPARIATAARQILERVEPLRTDVVLQGIAATGRLPDDVCYYPRTRLQDIAELSGGPADLALSRSVLEYISPDEISNILNSSHHWLKRDALWIHLIGTSDDRAREDKTLHRFDFLRYTEKEWNTISGNRYAFKNRLRLPQYRLLFQSAGWRVAREEFSVSESDVATLQRVPLHADFRNFSPADLVAGSIRFALVSANS